MIARVTVSRGVAAGAIGVLSVVVGGIGVAAAANGGSLTLGQHNAATKTTTLTDRHGTPLALVGKTSKPPLTVNSSKQVKRLNASLLDGKSATALSTYGSGAASRYSASNHGVLLSNTQLVVASTATLPAGTYAINAAAQIDGPVQDEIDCYLGRPAAVFSYANVFARGGQVLTAAPVGDAAEVTIPMTTVVHLSSPTKIIDGCFSQLGSTPGTTDVIDAGITAIRLATSTPGTAVAGVE